MTEINFQPVFDYIDTKVLELKEELASKEDLAKLQDSVDATPNNPRISIRN